MTASNKGILTNLFKEAGKVLVTLITGILIGFLALCLVHLLPVERMYQNVLASKDVINSHYQIIPGYDSTIVDNFTDSIMLSEAICPIEAPLIEKVIYNYQVNYFKQYDQQENLLHYLAGEEGYSFQGYTHYWGGHQVILKLLLLVFDYADILFINMILQTLLAVLIIAGLYRTGKKYAVLPFVVSILSIMPMTISLCMQYCDVYYIALTGAALIVWIYGRIPAEKICFLFLICGMATSYFDFLTYPFVSLGIPLVFLILFMDGKKLLEQLLCLIWSSALWCIGYVGMWAGKWILGSILLPEAGSFEVALKSISYRGSHQGDTGRITVFDVLLKNLYVYLKWPIILTMGILIIYYLWKTAAGRYFGKKALLSCIPYMLLAFYPLAWYAIACNHSYQHAFMAYRELVISAFACMCMFAKAGATAFLGGCQEVSIKKAGDF